MLNCFAMNLTRLKNKKKTQSDVNKSTMYFLEFLRISTVQTLHQGVKSQHFRQGCFQLQ